MLEQIKTVTVLLIGLVAVTSAAGEVSFLCLRVSKLLRLLNSLKKVCVLADLSIDWVIPSDRLPYPTTYIDLGDTVSFNWIGLHGVYELEEGSTHSRKLVRPQQQKFGKTHALCLWISGCYL